MVAAVPRETALVITLQRAANLPARLALSGGRAVRQGSPTRGSMAGGSGAASNRGTGSRFGTRDSQPAGRGSVVTGSAAAAGGPRAVADWAAGGPGWEDTEGDALGGSEGLSCFVEARFRGPARRTVAVDSDSPIWNEQVEVAGWGHVAALGLGPGRWR